jgi:hypothetical protein
MKKYLLVSFFILSLVEIKSQSLMTVGEIYDYNIGDIFIRNFGGYYSPPYISEVIITDKYFSSSLDTIFYTNDKYGYVPPACPTCSPSFDTTLGNVFYITNLDDTVGSGLGVKPYGLLSMGCLVDTTGYTGVWVDTNQYDPSFCNKQVTRISKIEGFLDYYDTCFWYFEPFTGYDDYAKGLGQVRHYYETCSQGNFNCQEGITLVFYKKGTDSCGTRPLITNISEKEIIKSFKIYPNPFSISTTLQTNINLKNADLSICNVLGEKIKTIKNISGTELILQRDNLQNGIYIILLTENNKVITTEKLIITD